MNKIQIEDKTFEILLENDNISKRTRLIGIQINVDYENRCPVFIGVLNGSFLFMADLLREIEIPCEIGFIRVHAKFRDGITPDAKDLFPKGRRDMHQAGVVTKDKPGLLYQRGRLV